MVCVLMEVEIEERTNEDQLYTLHINYDTHLDVSKVLGVFDGICTVFMEKLMLKVKIKNIDPRHSALQTINTDDLSLYSFYQINHAR